MTERYECTKCGAIFDAGLPVNAVCPCCQRGRTRQDIEIDVLVAMATLRRFGLSAASALKVEDFTVAEHRALFRGLVRAGPAPIEVDEWMARTLGCSITEALERRMAASPVTPREDLAWLVAKR